MGRNKLLKFQDNNNSNKVVQIGKPLFDKIKGNWAQLQFKNQNPITLEVACGRGEYAIGFARNFPGRNFVGIDLKGSRIWAGARTADVEGLDNAAFLRIQMHQLLDFFEDNEASEIWIIHPDPRPKKRDIRRRLTSPRYLDMYKQVLIPNGWIHLKTDSDSLFEYTMETLKARSDITSLVHTDDLDHSEMLQDHLGIKTRYEMMFREEGAKIKYLKFQFHQ